MASKFFVSGAIFFANPGQQISLPEQPDSCPAPERGTVSPRKIAPPTLADVRIFGGIFSIRPDSPYSGDLFYVFFIFT
jgi:hypothetical protein